MPALVQRATYPVVALPLLISRQNTIGPGHLAGRSGSQRAGELAAAPPRASCGRALVHRTAAGSRFTFTSQPVLNFVMCSVCVRIYRFEKTVSRFGTYREYGVRFFSTQTLLLHASLRMPQPTSAVCQH